MSRYTPNGVNILIFWYTILLLWRWLNLLPVWGYHAKCCTAKTNIPFHTVDRFQLEDVVLLGCLCLTSLSNHPVSCCLGVTCLLSFDFVTKHLRCFPYMSNIQRPKYNHLLRKRVLRDTCSLPRLMQFWDNNMILSKERAFVLCFSQSQWFGSKAPRVLELLKTIYNRNSFNEMPA